MNEVLLQIRLLTALGVWGGPIHLQCNMLRSVAQMSQMPYCFQRITGLSLYWKINSTSNNTSNAAFTVGD